MKSGRAGAGEQSGSEQSAEEQSENGAFDASWRFLQGGNFPGGIDSSTAAEFGVASPEAQKRLCEFVSRVNRETTKPQPGGGSCRPLANDRLACTKPKPRSRHQTFAQGNGSAGGCLHR
jgi:hypothetical protein